MEKKTIKISLFTAILLFLIVIALIGYFAIFKINNQDNNTNTNVLGNSNLNTTESAQVKEKEEKNEYSSNITIVTSLYDEITTNSAWCGTFQLAWNDMINNVIKQDVKFINGSNLDVAQKMADNLNKQTFKEEMLSEKDYYKVFDKMSLELKSKIEKAIKEKFNESSDILNDINWSNDQNSWVFYTMLKKEFNFKNDFDELENDKFANKYKDIKYFGINEDSDSKLYSQIDVLYYNDYDDYAVILNTKEGEQVILARGLEGKTFASLYNNLSSKTKEYSGNKKFTEKDTLKVPNIKIKEKKEFKELYDKDFLDTENKSYRIINALQTIQLDMDKSGGKIKSEAAIVAKENAIAVAEPVDRRNFNFDDKFTMFLKEKGKNVPYFAANIENITLFQ